MTGKNRNKVLIILIAVLVAVCALYFGISKFVENDAVRKESEAAAESEAGRIWVTKMENVMRIDIGSGENKLSFEKNGDIWYYEDDENFPVNQDILTSLASAAGGVEATRAMSESDALADYGLENPKIEVTVTDAENNRTTMLLGNSAGSEYYLKTADADTVYTVGSELVNAVKDKALYDFVRVEKLPSTSAEKILTMEVDVGGTAYKLERNETDANDEERESDSENDGNSGEDDKEGDKESDSESEGDSEEESATWTLYVEDKKQSGDNDNLGLKLSQTLSGMSIEGCVNYNAAEKQLSEYGLSNPPMRIVYTFQNDEESDIETVTLYVGNVTDDGETYYVLMNDLTSVNTISANTVEGIKNYISEND